MNIKNKSNDLLGIETKEDNEEVTNKEMDEWEWQSYHKIDVKQNMGNGGNHNENNQIKDNAQHMIDNYGGITYQLMTDNIKCNLQLIGQTWL